MAKQKMLYHVTMAEKSGTAHEEDVVAASWAGANTKADKLAKKLKARVTSLNEIGPAPEVE